MHSKGNPKDKTVVFQKDKIENEQIWTEFKETAAQKKACKVSIKIGDNDKYERTLEYDGNSYTYNVGKKSVKNVFLIDVRGKSDKSDKEQGYIALAGHNFTFEEITKVITIKTSNRSRKRKANIIIGRIK